jgi:hypothetical protein
MTDEEAAELVEELFQNVVGPNLLESIADLYWTMEVLDENDEESSIIVHVYECEAEIVGGKNDGLDGLYSGMQFDLLGIFRALEAPSDQVASHGIEFCSLVHCGDAHVEISGNYKGKNIVIRIHSRPESGDDVPKTRLAG